MLRSNNIVSDSSGQGPHNEVKCIFYFVWAVRRTIILRHVPNMCNCSGNWSQSVGQRVLEAGQDCHLESLTRGFDDAGTFVRSYQTAMNMAIAMKRKFNIIFLWKWYSQLSTQSKRKGWYWPGVDGMRNEQTILRSLLYPSLEVCRVAIRFIKQPSPFCYRIRRRLGVDKTSSTQSIDYAILSNRIASISTEKYLKYLRKLCRLPRIYPLYIMFIHVYQMRQVAAANSLWRKWKCGKIILRLQKMNARL